MRNLLLSILITTCISGGGVWGDSPYTITGMATQEILDNSGKLNSIKPSLFQYQLNLPKETIYELISSHDGLGWSLAIADIVDTVPHYHRRTLETYTVVTGILEVTVDDEKHVLHPGDVITIPIGSIHSARSLTQEPARILVSCLPGWTSDDHNLVETEKNKE